MRTYFPLPVMHLLRTVPCLVLPNKSDVYMPVSCPLPLTPNRYNSLKNLLLTFNGHTFYMLSNVITHICDYPEGEARVAL